MKIIRKVRKLVKISFNSKMKDFKMHLRCAPGRVKALLVKSCNNSEA